MDFPKYKAISFDFSGTLAVSESTPDKLPRKILQALRYPASNAIHDQLLNEIYNCYGNRNPKTLKDENNWLTKSALRIIKVVKIPKSVRNIEIIKKHLSPEQIKFHVCPDVEPTLRALEGWGIKRCVTSNSWPSLYHILAGLNIKKYFNTVVVSSKVGHEKPSRKIFEIAIRRLNVKAERMIHVGNDLDDVVGARNAGVTPVLIDRRGDKKMDCITIKNLKELLRYL